MSRHDRPAGLSERRERRVHIAHLQLQARRAGVLDGELWNARLNDVPSSAPISYLVNGRQYIALVTGNGGAQAATFPALVPEIRNPPDRGATLWVFELTAPQQTPGRRN